MPRHHTLFGFMIFAAALLSGCASTQTELPQPRRQLADVYTSQTTPATQFYVYDPISSTNRRVYKFNAQFDDYVYLPVTNAYTRTVPQPVRTGVTHFFKNLAEVNTFVNSVLQAKPKKAGTTLGRFAINSTVGVLGVFDVATPMGLNRQKEDFGQTLGRWGVPPGAYVVWPVFGPSNVRDTAGRVVDIITFAAIMPNAIDESSAYNLAQYTVRPVDMRANTDFRYYASGSPFEYELMRYLSDVARQAQVAQ